MFEQTQFAFSYDTAAIVLRYLLIININIFIFGLIGFFVDIYFKIKTPLVVKVLIGYVVYSASLWWLYKSGNAKFIMVLLLIIELLVAFYCFTQIQRKKYIFEDKRLLVISLFKKIWPLFFIQLVLVVFWSGFLTGNRYDIISSGNNDIYFWGFMSDHVLNGVGIDRINFSGNESYFQGSVVDCFGVYGWLGLFSQILMDSFSIKSAMLFQLTLLILSAWTIYEISRLLIGVNKIAAIFPALIFSFNPLWIYIFLNNFLSQMTATFCFLVSILLCGSFAGNELGKYHNIAFSFLVYSAFLFSYPGLLIPYILFFLLSLVCFNFFVCRAKNIHPWRCIKKLLFVNLIGIFLGGSLFFDMTNHAVMRFSTLSNVTAGWSLSLLDPRNLIGLVSYSLDNTMFSNWLTYIIIILVLVFILIISIFGVNNKSIYKAKYDSLLFLAIVSLVGYLGVYYVKGDGYQQWKFATYFSLPLAIIVVVNYFSPRTKNE
jgi:hypothetical protein